MRIGSLGIKIGMTQIFDIEKNIAIPVTLIKVGPSIVTHIKTNEKDGYDAIQLGFGFVLSNDKSTYIKTNKPEKGHLQKSNVASCSYICEYKVKNIEQYSIGQIIDVGTFQTGQFVDVIGKTIGKGFCGTVKRYNFGRGPMGHGSKNHRAPGSIGAGSTPGRVYPGKRMAGRKGGTQATIKNLQIIKIHSEEGVVAVHGAIPGKSGNLVNLLPSLKS
uniref:Large ribosomal subunit protein uL3c n=1 Tax=Eustigmatophyceae sp. Chic 10/23 P-6w TaxID=1446905 RepID=A0A3R5QN09_9STRA|nr:ribosomal protein L3 [Eustigmatophyceae sp. Chic 10/23 P-6w]QAA11538.1 ribosomal protein L3 [Eustigmatophyceae sp. Chic 10/23 P-6w]